MAFEVDAGGQGSANQAIGCCRCSAVRAAGPLPHEGAAAAARPVPKGVEEISSRSVEDLGQPEALFSGVWMPEDHGAVSDAAGISILQVGRAAIEHILYQKRTHVVMPCTRKLLPAGWCAVPKVNALHEGSFGDLRSAADECSGGQCSRRRQRARAAGRFGGRAAR